MHNWAFFTLVWLISLSLKYSTDLQIWCANTATDSYIHNWWCELPREDWYVLYSQCPLYIFGMLEGSCLTYKRVFVGSPDCNLLYWTLFEPWLLMTNSKLHAGREAPSARKDKKENSGAPGLWERWAIEGKFDLSSKVSPACSFWSKCFLAALWPINFLADNGLCMPSTFL